MTTMAEIARDTKERAVKAQAESFARQVKSARLCADAGLWTDCAAHLTLAASLAHSIAQNEMELAR